MGPVDICNQALDQLGQQVTISGINPPSPPNSVAAQIASRNYQTQVDSIFRAANWSTGRYQAPLTLLKAALGTPENPTGVLPVPPYPYNYEYAYPVDAIRIRFLLPTPNLTPGTPPTMGNTGINYVALPRTSTPFIRAIDKDANGNQIAVVLTNVRQAQAVYTVRVDNPDLWDPLLQNAIVAALAAWFCNPLSLSAQLLTQRTQIAAGILMQARIADANEGISTVDHLPDWMAVRNVGGGTFNGLDGGSSMWGNSWGGMNGGDYDTWGAPDGVFY